MSFERAMERLRNGTVARVGALETRLGNVLGDAKTPTGQSGRSVLLG